MDVDPDDLTPDFDRDVDDTAQFVALPTASDADLDRVVAEFQGGRWTP